MAGSLLLILTSIRWRRFQKEMHSHQQAISEASKWVITELRNRDFREFYGSRKVREIRKNTQTSEKIVNKSILRQVFAWKLILTKKSREEVTFSEEFYLSYECEGINCFNCCPLFCIISYCYCK
ncbi:unnamed protein product [Larinioides sclopetarius]|uniref:Uncharacterized protein n=1 Tax=Larinioides sclopetarius TaxID=280406 RepID=A0AAV1ZDU0_9ARAC